MLNSLFSLDWTGVPPDLVPLANLEFKLFRGSGSDVIKLVTGSGPVVQGVLYLLILISVASWGIILYKYLLLRRTNRATGEFLEVFWSQKNLSAIFDEAKNHPESPMAELFAAGYQELVKLSKSQAAAGAGDVAAMTTELVGIENVERAMRKVARAQITRLEGWLTFLATTGSTAPFIGLFGTVWGIVGSFQNIGLTGSASLAVVAPGISEALIATATGLAAAIPAVVAYNHYGRKIRTIAAEMENFAGEFLNIADLYFRRRRGKPGAAPASAAV